MRYVKQLLVFLLLALVLIYWMLFAVQNTATVPLDLLLVQFSAQRVSIWLIMAFVFGGVFGILASMWAIIRLKSQTMLLQRKVDKHEKALTRAQTEEF